MLTSPRAQKLMVIGLCIGAALGAYVFFDEHRRISGNRPVSRAEAMFWFGAIVSTAALCGGSIGCLLNLALAFAEREVEGVRRILLVIFAASAVMAPLGVYSIKPRYWRPDAADLAMFALQAACAWVLLAVAALTVVAIVRWIGDGFRQQ